MLNIVINYERLILLNFKKFSTKKTPNSFKIGVIIIKQLIGAIFSLGV